MSSASPNISSLWMSKFLSGREDHLASSPPFPPFLSFKHIAISVQQHRTAFFAILSIPQYPSPRLSLRLISLDVIYSASALIGGAHVDRDVLSHFFVCQFERWIANYFVGRACLFSLCFSHKHVAATQHKKGPTRTQGTPLGTPSRRPDDDDGSFSCCTSPSFTSHTHTHQNCWPMIPCTSLSLSDRSPAYLFFFPFFSTFCYVVYCSSKCCCCICIY